MDGTRKNRAVRIAVIGGLIAALIMVLGTVWLGRNTQRDASQSVRTVSLMFLDELAERREQVVEQFLNDNIQIIHVAIGLMTYQDLSNQNYLQEYERKMKALFELERFALVDADGLIYTSHGVETNIGEYAFNYRAMTEPSVTLKKTADGERKVVIAVPVEHIAFKGKPIVVCFMELDVDVLLSGVSIAQQSSEATFCNLYTGDGVPLSGTVLGGLAEEDNLLAALSRAEYSGGDSFAKVAKDFRDRNNSVVTFKYNGIQETLSYIPVRGTDWMLTYLVRESVIQSRISTMVDNIVLRGAIQSVVTALALLLVFFVFARQMRANTRLLVEKEASETENRIRQQELEQRLALQEELLAQRGRQEQQQKLITALASDYRGVYYVNLDQGRGVCYEAQSEFTDLEPGREFDYQRAAEAYCEQFVTEPYRAEFLRFIQPDNIREALQEERVISYRYVVRRGGRETYEMVRIAGVRHPEDRDDHRVHSIGVGFADVDLLTRKEMLEQKTLSDALSAAEQASKAKTAFLSSMSHELRTPMNAVIGLKTIALNDPAVSEKTRGYLNRIGEAAQHLLEIINDILDMSRIESGRMTLRNEEFSFTKLLEQVNVIVGGQCREKGLRYECETAGELDEYFIGDGNKLKQVVLNILDNAVKFTPEGGAVCFRVEEGQRYQGKATVKLTVRDTGVGMSADFMPHVFDPFSMEDATTTSKYHSTGLGMPITKNLVEMMNGQIEFESAKGVGTIFTVTVPLGESDRRKGPAEDTVELPKDMTVLVIDDDPIALESVELVLNKLGIRCELAKSGAQALELSRLRHARGNDYHLYLIDWVMPEMDGLETTRRIRELVGEEAPVLIMTSYSWDEIADEAPRAGVDAILEKPLEPGSLLDELRAAFGKRQGRAAPKKAELDGRRILLAEDMPINAEIVQMVLEMRGMESDHAENGRIAVDLYESHPAGYYDAVLMDMRMPEMDGLEATRAIRASGRPDAETIPIIALSANALDEDVQRSLQAGLNAHLAKPVEPDLLFETLERFIRP